MENWGNSCGSTLGVTLVPITKAINLGGDVNDEETKKSIKKDGGEIKESISFLKSWGFLNQVANIR